MKTIFIVTFVDLEHVGYNPSKVEIFNTKEEASEFVKKQYIEKCNEKDIPEVERFLDDDMDKQYTPNFAYIFGSYYWDVFEKNIDM